VEREDAVIRLVQEADMEALLAIRREALTNDPAAFSASVASDRALDPESVRALLAHPDLHAVFGAFRGNDLVGMTGVYRHRTEKERHKAVVWGMYVRRTHRGAGLGRALLAEAVRFARSLAGVTHLHLSVSESARSAQNVYEAAGFAAWGIEPASLYVNGEFITVRHMVLDLRTPPS
jgi:GNAT superfamily N-acetyltransferase